MNVKVCRKCGWEYARITPYKRCVFCKEPFVDNFCSRCGEFAYIVPGTKVCQACFDSLQEQRKATLAKRQRVRAVQKGMSRNAQHYRRLKAKAITRYDNWLIRLTAANAKAHSLTESEWIEACNYFKGCALCNSKSIDTRGYFIDFAHGGKYNACNVIPLCEHCATRSVMQPNPFIRFNSTINRSLATINGYSCDKLNAVAGYLEHKMEEVENAP